jgi:hypothetical protein
MVSATVGSSRILQQIGKPCGTASTMRRTARQTSGQ